MIGDGCLEINHNMEWPTIQSYIKGRKAIENPTAKFFFFFFFVDVGGWVVAQGEELSTDLKNKNKKTFINEEQKLNGLTSVAWSAQ